MGLLIPEVVIYKVINALFKQTILDWESNPEKKDTILYSLFGKDEDGDPLEFVTFNYFDNAPDLLVGKKEERVNNGLKVDVHMGYNLDRAGTASIHILLPSESPFSSPIGQNEGFEDPEINSSTDEITSVYTNKSQVTYNLLVTSANYQEVLIIYNFLKAAFLSVGFHLAEKGLENVQLAGSDLNFQDDLVPSHVFHRNFNVNFTYDYSAPDFFSNKFTKNFLLKQNIVPESKDEAIDPQVGDVERFPEPPISIPAPPLSDPNVTAFVTFYGITDQAEIDAYNTFVPGLKTDGLWNKFFAIHVISPTSKAASLGNLVDPTKFELILTEAPGQFNHNAQGLENFSGQSYADTQFNPATEGVDFNDFSMGVYIQTASTVNEAFEANFFDFGTFTFTGYGYDATNVDGLLFNSGGASTVSHGGNVTGLTVISREAANTLYVYKGTAQGNIDNSTASGPSNLNFVLWGEDGTGAVQEQVANTRISFHFFATGLNAAEQALLAARIDQLQSDLGR